MKKILCALLFLSCSSVIAKTTSVRNTSNYYLGGYALHFIYTNPIQANQPVYAWRTHTNFDGTAGIHTQNGELIGHTDNNGVLSIVLQNLPSDPIHCGWISGETVAVGSRSSRRSNALDFSIRIGLVGPLPPWANQCRPGLSQ